MLQRKDAHAWLFQLLTTERRSADKSAMREHLEVVEALWQAERTRLALEK